MNKLKNKLRQASVAMAIMVMTISSASADNDIADSTIGVGLKAMIEDASTFLVVLCPLVGAAAFAWFMMRRGAADEQDGIRWQKRAVMAVVCGVGGMLGAAFIAIVSGYFL